MTDNTSYSTHFESLYPEDSRFKEIEKILAFIKEGNSCQVIGLPGVDRSNLLGLLSYNRNVRLKHFGENQKWFHFVTINFSEVSKKPLLDITKFLLLNLVDSLRERNMTEEYKVASDILKESLGFNDELILFQGLKRTVDFLALEKELTIVFLFDKFDQYIPMLTSEFFTNLQVLRNRAKYRFAAAFSVNRPIEQMVGSDILSDFYTFMAGHTVFLPIYDSPSLQFRLSYLEKTTGKKLPAKIKEEILFLTAGHGKMTRICAEEILTNNCHPELVSGSSISGSRSRNKFGMTPLKEFLLNNRAVRSVSYEIWESLTPSERKFLINVISSTSSSVISRTSSLTRRTRDPQEISRLRLEMTDSVRDDRNNEYLQNIGLLNTKITIPLFEEFVKYRAEHQTTEKITLNTTTNEVLRGEEVISDNLTKGELKLLKFLIEDQGRIVEREEIINVVWSDLQSKEGVTDQALDQLIFRLRRKIEEDPNNPIHLQTIKGRGFKFLP